MQELAFGLIITLLFIALIVLFCLVLIKLYVSKITKYNQLIFEKEISFQKQINETILDAQEQTLQNLSQELHDDAGQQLTLINLQLESYKLDHPSSELEINPISQSVQELSNTIRALSHSIGNQLLHNINLIEAIENECNRINRVGKMHVVFHNEVENWHEFDFNTKLILYRIFQEIINNSIKHSKAKTLTIRVTNEPKFILEINDDGIGYDFDNLINSSKSNGLKNIKNRAELINFTLEFKNFETKGCSIKIIEP